MEECFKLLDEISGQFHANNPAFTKDFAISIVENYGTHFSLELAKQLVEAVEEKTKK